MIGNRMHESTTRGIKHWGLSGYSSILPRIKFGVTGQESSPQSPTISYRNPLCLMLRDRANAHPQTTHLKIPHANPLPKFLKELFFPIAQRKLSNNLRILV